MLIGQLLDFVLHAAFVVFGDFLVLDQLLERVVGVAAQIAHGNLGVFAFGADHFGQVTPPLFGERRHGNTDVVAHGDRVQPQIGIAYGFFYGAGHVLFPDLHADGTSVDQVDVGNLTDRHRGAVICDHDKIGRAHV